MFFHSDSLVIGCGTILVGAILPPMEQQCNLQYDVLEFLDESVDQFLRRLLVASQISLFVDV